MDAELIVVSGSLLGERFPLGTGDLRIGKSPSADLRLNDAEVAAEHCVVSSRDGRYRLTDRRSTFGTYVNGMRVTEHWLEPGDQVSVGEAVLMFREDSSESGANSTQHLLLRACSLVFLFRAIAESQSDPHRCALEAHTVRLLADVVPCTGGSILLGRGESELRAAARRHPSAADLESLAAASYHDGAVVDSARGAVAVTLYVRGAVAGVLAASFPPEESVNLADHRDTLGAIATLAGAALESVREVERLRTENTLLRERIGLTETGIVGESIAIHSLLKLIGRVAPQDTSVLILGESGTGKELVARALHRLSARTAKPFVAINCAALTETLLESELFGHEKGAFTGAVAQKKGKLEMAEGGTVFLDEIGELAPQLQAKFLRVLQQREFERVGGTHTLKLDVRLIAATNRDLAAEARRGAFREDLYHRLNVVSLLVPPLRERPADIPALARYFLDRASTRCGRAVRGISPEAEQWLQAHTWPGNVRELENAIERAVVLGESDVLLPEDLPETIFESMAPSEAPTGLQSSVTESKRQLIRSAWLQSGGDHNLAAARLHLHPNSLRRLIRTLNLREQLG